MELTIFVLVPAVQYTKVKQHKKKKKSWGNPTYKLDGFLRSPQFLETQIILGFSISNFTFIYCLGFFFLHTISTSPYLVYLKLVWWGFLRVLFSRSSLLRSLLQPESVRLDWLCLAVSHDAPQRANTVDAEGNPR